MPESYPILRNAPITEALIDIRVKLSPDLKVEKIDSIHELIKEQYPERKTQKKSEFMFEPGTVKQTSAVIVGYRYSSSDKKQIVQTRLDGFTFSRLHPYTKWDELRNEAHRLWLLYRDITSPESITRVALRYINNLNIPMPIKDFSEYLTADPKVPEGLPQSVSSFLTRVVIHEENIGAHGIITQALEQVVPDRVPIILDVDVFKLRPEGIEEKEAWEILEKLRDFKNRIFFKSITPTLLEIYK